MAPVIDLIVAASLNNGIGFQNTIPWRIKEDLRYFRRITTGSAVVFGRRTAESIGRPLPDRINIVLSGGVSLESVIADSGAERVFIAGGERVYREALERLPIRRVYLTRVFLTPEADTFLVGFDPEKFSLVESSEVLQENSVYFQHLVYEAKDE